MALSSFESLQQLINSLNAAEKDAIRQRSLVKHNRNGPATYIKLYDLMQKNPSADEEMIFNRWIRTHVKMVNKHAFENARTQLKNFILESLRGCIVYDHETVQQKIEYADILISKGMKEEAFKMLNSVEFSQNDAHSHLYNIIINYKKILLIPYVNKHDTEVMVKHTLKENSKLIAESEIFNEIYAFNIEVGMLARTTTIVKTRLQREKASVLFTHPATYIPISPLSVKCKTLLFKTYTWLYRIVANNRQAFNYQLLVLQTMLDEENTYLKNQPQVYLSEIADMISLSLRTDDLDKAEYYLEKYAGICSLLGLNKELNLLVQNNYKINIELAKNTLTADNEILHKQLLLLKSNPWRIQRGHFASFLFTVMKGFFITGQYKTVINCYAELLQDEPKEREDVLFCAELIYTLSLYHLQPLDLRYHMFETTKLFRDQAESLQRRLRSSKEDLPLELNLSNCLRNLANKSRFKHHIQVIRKLLINQEALEAKGYIYQEQFYRLFNVQKWAEQHIAFLEKYEPKKGDEKSHRPGSNQLAFNLER